MRGTRLATLSICLGNAVGASGGGSIPLWVTASVKGALLTATTAGWLASGELFLIALGVLTTSVVGGRGNTRIIAVAAALVVLCGDSLAMVPAAATLVAGRLLSGGAVGVLLACVTGAAARRPDAQRVFAMMQVTVVVLLSVVFFLAPHLIERFGVAGLFGMLVLNSLFFLIVALFGFPINTARAAEDGAAVGKATMIFKWAPLLGCIALGIMAMGQGTVWTYIVSIGSAL